MTTGEAPINLEAHSIAFRSMFLEIVEELRFRRGCDAVSDAHIRQLISEKYELQHKLGSDRRMYQESQQMRNKEFDELKIKHEEMIRTAAEEKEARSVLVDKLNKEVSTLQDEIYKLQMKIMAMEKRAKEMESKFRLQVNLEKATQSQFMNIKQLMEDVEKKCQQVTNAQLVLEQQVCDAIGINRQLVQDIERHVELVKSVKRDNNHYRAEVVISRAQVKDFSMRLNCVTDKYKNELLPLQEQLRTKDDLIQRLQQELVDQQQHNLTTLKHLQDSSSLVSQLVVKETAASTRVKALETELQLYKIQPC